MIICDRAGGANLPLLGLVLLSLERLLELGQRIGLAGLLLGLGLVLFTLGRRLLGLTVPASDGGLGCPGDER